MRGRIIPPAPYRIFQRLFQVVTLFIPRCSHPTLTSEIGYVNEIRGGDRRTLARRGARVHSGRESHVGLRPGRGRCRADAAEPVRRAFGGGPRSLGGVTPMISPGTLLVPRLMPPAIGRLHLRRPRLMDRLRAGLESHSTTVLLAGPGYGKTALLALFLQESGEDSVWYSLDASDRDPTVFFRYLAQGVMEHAPEFGTRSQGLWAT